MARLAARRLGWGFLIATVFTTAGAAVLPLPATRADVPPGIPSSMVLTNGHNEQAVASASPSEDNDLSVSLSTDKAPTGSGTYVFLVGRQTLAGQYEAKVRFVPEGPVTLGLVRRDPGGVETPLGAEQTLAGVTSAPGEQLRVRMRVNGTDATQIQAKGWPAASIEPDVWNVTGSDTFGGLQLAGLAGLRGYLSRAATNAPVAVAIRDFVLAPTLPGPAPEPEPVGRATKTAGAAALGTTRYSFPDSALFVWPGGNDASPGTQEQPLRTVALAVARAANPSTIVLRGGTYHESVTVPVGKAVSLQAYPGEEVWFDGTTSVSQWVSDSGAWRSDGWTPRFDHSPTYTPGAPDSTQPGWSFVNAAHPMAAHPDMVFIDGVAQRQVGSRGEVTDGTFFADYDRSRLYLGTDPGGRAVRASDLSTAITVRGAGSAVKGIGVRRYATSVPQKGALLALAPKVTVENVVVSDNATQGLFAGGRDLGTSVTLRHVTTERNGLLGVESSYSDGLRLEGVRAAGNNSEHFNMAPVSGGVKITRARGVAVTASVLADNEGPGLWLDESVYDATVIGNDLLRNKRHGLSFEISAKGVFADNLVAGNAGNGMKLNNSSDLQVWNNTFVDNGDKPLWLVQDSRVATNLATPGHDPRQVLPDPTVTWILGPATVRNNVFSRTSASCLVCVEDTALLRGATTIGVSLDGDVYHRSTSSSPSWLAVWANGTSRPSVFSDLGSFRSYTGQEARGREFTGAAVVDDRYELTPELSSLQASTAVPLSPAVAALAGRAAGGQHLGAWFE